MTWAALLLFTLVFAAACATPGPSTLALVGRVLGQGMRGTPWLCLGLVIGDLVWLLVAAKGAAALAEHVQPLIAAIKFGGAAYLLRLAWKFWTAAPARIDGNATVKGEGLRLLLTGLSIALGNPKTMLFYLALLPNLVDVAGLALPDLLVLVTTVTLVYTSILAGYAVLAARARGLIGSSRSLRHVNRASGALMAGTAVVIATR
jgi:threonine/homoserine/homoserine lactone efflux protein